jgi:TolA-binding protein
MKNLIKLLFGIVLVASLLLTACAPPPPPVSRDQLEQAEMDAVEAEETAEELRRELSELREQLRIKEVELESLKEYERQLGE